MKIIRVKEVPRTTPPKHHNMFVQRAVGDSIGSVRDAAAKVLKLDPNFSLKYYATMFPFKNQNDREQLINTLRKAGLK